MTFKEVASRITGISIPVFGVSWNPPKLEKQVAEKIITYLEDRRVLYNPYELESPKHCVESINQIRSFLTEQLYDVDRDSELSLILRAMRDACRKCLDMVMNTNLHIENGYQMGGLGEQMIFFSGVGELRGVFGLLIAKVLVMHGIDCETNLIKILPLQYLEDQ